MACCANSEILQPIRHPSRSSVRPMRASLNGPDQSGFLDHRHAAAHNRWRRKPPCPRSRTRGRCRNRRSNEPPERQVRCRHRLCSGITIAANTGSTATRPVPASWIGPINPIPFGPSPALRPSSCRWSLASCRRDSTPSVAANCRLRLRSMCAAWQSCSNCRLACPRGNPTAARAGRCAAILRAATCIRPKRICCAHRSPVSRPASTTT